ncbi:hypothetical protein ACSSV1_004058 [Labrenzia sp. MBR-25]
MSTKLNRDEILREMLITLIKGWGRKAVYDTLDEIAAQSSSASSGERGVVRKVQSEPSAVQLVEELPLLDERKQLMLQLAKQFDAGTAFPKISDVRNFLASRSRNPKEVRSRDQGFRKMLPLLQEMSAKGLLKVMSRSHHSGPAELGSISDAIKDAGQNLRGSNFDDDGN